jgi:hypothetical protein
MPTKIGVRIYNDFYSLNTAVGTTDEIAFTSGITKGVLIVPTGSAITTITVHAADNSGGVFLPLYDAAGVAVTMAVAAGRVYVLTAAISTPTYIKMVTNAAGSVNIQYVSEL